MILLGIRTSLKTDTRCTTAELVYGTTLRLPGEFFNTFAHITTTDPSDYVTKLKDIKYCLQQHLLDNLFAKILLQVLLYQTVCMFSFTMM